MINKIFKDRSKLLFILAIIQLFFNIYYLVYFNYLDRLSYEESINSSTTNLALFLQNMYTSTFWGLMILFFSLISIFSLVAFVYKDCKFQFISICLWIVMFILAINPRDSLVNNLSIILIFIPLIVINILAYKSQKNILK